MKNKHTPILLVEDNLLDVANIKRSFGNLGIENPIYVATTGQLALDMLRGIGSPVLVPFPRIILLDLNLPGMSGLEFLRILRQDEVLKGSSVFVMTNSDMPQDVWEAYDLNVAGYLVKPLQYQPFLEMIKTLQSYLDLIEMPT